MNSQTYIVTQKLRLEASGSDHRFFQEDDSSAEGYGKDSSKYRFYRDRQSYQDQSATENVWSVLRNKLKRRMFGISTKEYVKHDLQVVW